MYWFQNMGAESDRDNEIKPPLPFTGIMLSWWSARIHKSSWRSEPNLYESSFSYIEEQVFDQICITKNHSFSRDKYGPAHHHISFGYNKFTGEVEFINSDNDPKKFKGLILRLTGAEFRAIPKGFKDIYSDSNYLTHANRVEKSTNDVSFPITCVHGDLVKVEATMAVHKFLFFYDLVGDFICWRELNKTDWLWHFIDLYNNLKYGIRHFEDLYQRHMMFFLFFHTWDLSFINRRGPSI